MIRIDDETINENIFDAYRGIGAKMVVDIDSVARWILPFKEDDEGFDWEKWNTVIVPPAPMMLFNYYIKLAGYITVFTHCVDIRDKDSWSIYDKEVMDDFTRNTPKILGHEETRWMCNMKTYASSVQGMNDAIFAGDITFSLDEYGTKTKGFNIRIPDAFGDAMTDSGVLDDDLYKGCVTTVTPVFASLAMMHCKNIELVDKPISRSERRRAIKTGSSLITRKTLNIEPFKRQVRNESARTGQSQIKMAMHICRGHFREYSEERPLFGKYAGRFWIPQHAKGSKSEGTVKKDYKVDV